MIPHSSPQGSCKICGTEVTEGNEVHICPHGRPCDGTNEAGCFSVVLLAEKDRRIKSFCRICLVCMAESLCGPYRIEGQG